MRIENGKAKFDQRMRWMLCRILELADPPGPFTSDTAEAFVGGFLLACLNRIEGQQFVFDFDFDPGCRRVSAHALGAIQETGDISGIPEETIRDLGSPRKRVVGNDRAD